MYGNEVVDGTHTEIGVSGGDFKMLNRHFIYTSVALLKARCFVAKTRALRIKSAMESQSKSRSGRFGCSLLPSLLGI
jgi:hypothetical protein